jgi:hypothetical protein
MLSAVPAQLTKDRVLLASNDDGNLTLIMSGFQQSVYLISLFAGKLCVAHLCASLTWSLKSMPTLPSLPFNY